MRLCTARLLDVRRRSRMISLRTVSSQPINVAAAIKRESSFALSLLHRGLLGALLCAAAPLAKNFGVRSFPCLGKGKKEGKSGQIADLLVRLVGETILQFFQG